MLWWNKVCREAGQDRISWLGFLYFCALQATVGITSFSDSDMKDKKREEFLEL